MGTISSTIAQTVTLGSVDSYPTYSSPLTIASSGLVATTATAAIYGPPTQPWTIINDGKIIDNNSHGIGITLGFGGTVINDLGGTISGYNGVVIGAAEGSVANSGTIYGFNYGVDLTNGGSVINHGAILAWVGIAIGGTGGTVTNDGYIGGVLSVGVKIAAGGMVTNKSSGVIEGRSACVEISNATLLNAGTLKSQYFGFGVHMLHGGMVINEKGGLIENLVGKSFGIWAGSGPGYVNNAGNIIDAAAGIGFSLGGTIVNQAGGTIAGTAVGIYCKPDLGTTATSLVTITNAGLISGQTNGIYALPGGIVTNLSGGQILATNAGNGSAITFAQGGTVTNNAGGTISGYEGLAIAGALGMVENDGYIGSKASNGVGVDLRAGGTVTNHADGILAGGIYAVRLDGMPGTVVNEGYIGDVYVHNREFFAQTGVWVGAGGVVDNKIGGTISGLFAGVGLRDATGMLVNIGMVGGSIAGAYMRYGGVVINQQGALIQGPTGVNFGIWARRGPGYVDNAGNITNAGAGILFTLGGTIVNERSGTISGTAIGVECAPSSVGTLVSGPGTITNSGRISGDGYQGIYLYSGGTVINKSGGIIIGMSSTSIGALIKSGGSIVNAGTIAGGMTGAAIKFVGSDANRVIVEPGAVFNGVLMGGSGNDTLELDGTAGNPLTVNYNALGLSNFEDVAFGGGGYARLVVTNTSGTLGVTISNFASASDVIDLTAIGTDGQIINNDTINHVLTVIGSAGSVSLQLDASDATSFTTASDGALGTDVLVSQAVCFCRGTRILTDRGEVAIEELAVGDRVATLGGECKPVRWIGFGRDLVTRANRLARPILVRKGALADGVPARDLYVTHGHALYFPDASGVLVPVEHLVNHRSIAWDENARVVEYYHIELDDHDVVFAEGAAAESYYDAGNRALFHNARGRSHAGAAPLTVAPVLHDGDIVGEIWARLLARAGGHPVGRSAADVTTDDPDLHVVVTGRRLDPASAAAGLYRFAIDRPPTAEMRLRSRSVVPSLAGGSRHEHRRLGVAIRQLMLQQPGVLTVLDCDAPLLRQGGCYPAEHGYCWTDGDLVLPAAVFAHLRGAFTLLVHTRCHALRYPVAAEVASAGG